MSRRNVPPQVTSTSRGAPDTVEPLVHRRSVLRQLLDRHDTVLVDAAVGGRDRHDGPDPDVTELRELPDARLDAVDVRRDDGRSGGVGRGGPEPVPAGAVGVLGDLHLAVVADPDGVDGHVDPHVRHGEPHGRWGGGDRWAEGRVDHGDGRPCRAGRGVGRGVAVEDGDAATTGPEAGSGPVHAVSRAVAVPSAATVASTRAETRERADALPGRDVAIMRTVSSAGWRRDGRARHRSDRRRPDRRSRRSRRTSRPRTRGRPRRRSRRTGCCAGR